MIVKVVPVGMVNVFPAHIINGEGYWIIELSGSTISSEIQLTNLKPLADMLDPSDVGNNWQK